MARLAAERGIAFVDMFDLSRRAADGPIARRRRRTPPVRRPIRALGRADRAGGSRPVDARSRGRVALARSRSISRRRASLIPKWWAISWWTVSMTPSRSASGVRYVRCRATAEDRDLARDGRLVGAVGGARHALVEAVEAARPDRRQLGRCRFVLDDDRDAAELVPERSGSASSASMTKASRSGSPASGSITPSVQGSRSAPGGRTTRHGDGRVSPAAVEYRTGSRVARSMMTGSRARLRWTSRDDHRPDEHL